MNLIEKQAKHFAQFKMRESKPYQDYIDLVKLELFNYSRIPHKLQFIETLMFHAKDEYEKHLPSCTNLDGCPTNFFYEIVIFFLNEIRFEFTEDLTNEDFKEVDVLRYKTGIDEILKRLNEVQLGQQLTYDDFSEQFEEMKSLFYLDKKTWQHTLTGKLIEMVAAGVVSETLSKEFIQIFSEV